MIFILRSIEEIIQNYSGELPLAHYLKIFYKSHPKLGSRDRRVISEAVYIYYRTALFFPSDSGIIEIIGQGLILCHSENEFLKKICPENLPTTHPNFHWQLGKKDIPLSTGINEKEWIEAHLQQPNLFLRIQKKQKQNVKRLDEVGIPYHSLSLPGTENYECLALPNGSKVDQILPAEDYVIQDYSSQLAIALAAQFRNATTVKASVWDVCAGAGGKSIFWQCLFPDDVFFVTDIRKSILHNLKERFKLLGFKPPKMAVMDLSQPNHSEQVKERFDVVICDVPCSGSGTWSRTPEQFYFFKKENLQHFEEIQFPIAFNASRKLKPGGLLIYITCSVFEVENETVIDRLIQSGNLQIVHQELINGIKNKADSMFVAVLENPVE